MFADTLASFQQATAVQVFSAALYTSLLLIPRSDSKQLTIQSGNIHFSLATGGYQGHWLAFEPGCVGLIKWFHCNYQQPLTTIQGNTQVTGDCKAANQS